MRLAVNARRMRRANYTCLHGNEADAEGVRTPEGVERKSEFKRLVELLFDARALSRVLLWTSRCVP